MSNFLNKKAFEISFAVFRVAALIKKPALQMELEKLASEFVSLVGKNDLGRALNLADGLKNTIRLGEAVLEIKQINASVLLRELGSFESLARVESGKDLEIESLFSQPSLLEAGLEFSQFDNSAKAKFSSAIIRQESGKKSGNNPAIINSLTINPAEIQEKLIKSTNNPAKVEFSSTESGKEYSKESGKEFGNAGLILAEIRQLGDCQTKDLAGLFPHLSERTLRGYLKILCDKGLLERFGAGGPDSRYRIYNL